MARGRPSLGQKWATALRALQRMDPESLSRRHPMEGVRLTFKVSEANGGDADAPWSERARLAHHAELFRQTRDAYLRTLQSEAAPALPQSKKRRVDGVVVDRMLCLYGPPNPLAIPAGPATSSLLQAPPPQPGPSSRLEEQPWPVAAYVPPPSDRDAALHACPARTGHKLVYRQAATPAASGGYHGLGVADASAPVGWSGLNKVPGAVQALSQGMHGNGELEMVNALKPWLPAMGHSEITRELQRGQKRKRPKADDEPKPLHISFRGRHGRHSPLAERPRSLAERLRDRCPPWTTEESGLLRIGVRRYGRNWKLLSEVLRERSVLQRHTRSAAECEKQWKLISGAKARGGGGRADDGAAVKVPALYCGRDEPSAMGATEPDPVRVGLGVGALGYGISGWRIPPPPPPSRGGYRRLPVMPMEVDKVHGGLSQRQLRRTMLLYNHVAAAMRDRPQPVPIRGLHSATPIQIVKAHDSHVKAALKADTRVHQPTQGALGGLLGVAAAPTRIIDRRKQQELKKQQDEAAKAQAAKEAVALKQQQAAVQAAQAQQQAQYAQQQAQQRAAGVPGLAHYSQQAVYQQLTAQQLQQTKAHAMAATQQQLAQQLQQYQQTQAATAQAQQWQQQQQQQLYNASAAPGQAGNMTVAQLAQAQQAAIQQQVATSAAATAQQTQQQYAQAQAALQGANGTAGQLMQAAAAAAAAAAHGQYNNATQAATAAATAIAAANAAGTGGNAATIASQLQTAIAQAAAATAAAPSSNGATATAGATAGFLPQQLAPGVTTVGNASEAPAVAAAAVASMHGMTTPTLQYVISQAEVKSKIQEILQRTGLDYTAKQKLISTLLKKSSEAVGAKLAHTAAGQAQAAPS